MSTVFDKIALGLEEAIAYEKGELEAKKTKVTVEPVTEFRSGGRSAPRGVLCMKSPKIRHLSP